jgi:hypothetical protein
MFAIWLIHATLMANVAGIHFLGILFVEILAGSVTKKSFALEGLIHTAQMMYLKSTKFVVTAIPYAQTMQFVMDLVPIVLKVHTKQT